LGWGVTVPALGMTWASRTKAETDRSGRIKVGPQLTVANYPDIYLIGDLALALDPNGTPLQGVAQVAMQQATCAAKAIGARVQGKPKQADFKYFDKGNLAVIGRWSAVANTFGVTCLGCRLGSYGRSSI
jgi:NADH dehydrogenase